MGYNNWPIAQVKEPNRLSLSNVPSFITVDRNNTGARVKLLYEITVYPGSFSTSGFFLNILKSNGELLKFEATFLASEAVGRKFKIESYPFWANAQNLYYALISDPWLSANFNISIPVTVIGSSVSNGAKIVIESKGFGEEYQILINGGTEYIINAINPTTTNQDSLSGESSTAQIDAYVHLAPDVFLGSNDLPNTTAKMGNFAVTLNKTYFSGKQTWFDLNNVFGHAQNYTRPPELIDWFNTGTLSRYRVVLQTSYQGNRIPFYTTNTFYVLNGYTRAFEGLDMENYIFDRSKSMFKLLTNKPRTTYVKGQREFINFVFADPQRNTPVNNLLDFQLMIVYRAFSASGEYLGQSLDSPINRADLYEVNTRELDLESFIESIPEAGRVEVGLAILMPNLSTIAAVVSNYLEYIVRPENISKENTFIFLNALGGWDSYNADADTTDSFKVQSETFLKTITPQSTKGDAIEATYSANLDEEFIVEGAPVQDDVAKWLKELTVSKAILYKGRRILIEDVALPRNGSNFYRPVIKFKYSESFTNV